jgi:sugar phosphate permease
MRIIPPTIIIYIVAYMDRVNFGFAMAGGMNEALGMSATLSGIAAGIFFWGYMVLPIPGGHVAEHGSARNFILWTIIGWGGISFLSGFVQTGWEMLGMRFLLGVAEGGLYPAILVLVGNWFPHRELGRANALFLTSAPLSSVISDPLSGWIVAHYTWRGLFFFEGVVSLALIFVWLPLVSDRPADAKWISAAERDYLVTTLAAEKAEQSAAFKTAPGAKPSYAELLRNPYLWLMIAIYFCYAVGLYGYLLWLPTLLKSLTRASLTNVGWLSVAPMVLAVGGLYLFGALSDRKGNRRLPCAVTLSGFGIAYGLSTLFPNHVWVAYGFIMLAGLFVKAVQAPFWAMPSLVFPPGVAGGARGMINGVGNLGGFAGPAVVGWLTSKTGNMNCGIYFLTGTLILGAFLTMLMPGITAGFKVEAGGKQPEPPVEPRPAAERTI